jgi:hypothetical protein
LKHHCHSASERAGRSPCRWNATDPHLAIVRSPEKRGHLKQGALPRPVWSDYGTDLAGFNREVVYRERESISVSNHDTAQAKNLAVIPNFDWASISYHAHEPSIGRRRRHPATGRR